MTPVITALLSYGMSGKVFHAPLISAHGGFHLKKVLQRRGDEAAHDYPGVTVVGELGDILNDREIELIIVNTPNDTHASFATACLEAGKHVVVEKPFTVTSAEGEALIACATRNQRLLSVFQNRRWDGDFLTISQVIRNEWLGRLAEFEAHYDRYRPSVDAGSWKEKKGHGVGIVYNLGSHMIDQMITLFGIPSEVDARIGIQRPGGNVDDYYDMRFTYPGSNAVLKSSYLVREPVPRYTLHGQHGSFIKYGIDPQEEQLKKKHSVRSENWGLEDAASWGVLNTSIQGLHVQGKIETLPGNYLAYYQNLFEAIRKGAPLAVTAQQALHVIRLIEYGYQSQELKKRVAINL